MVRGVEECLQVTTEQVPSQFLLSSSGWWFCQCESKRGWVPASYLEPLDGPEEAEDAAPNYEGRMSFRRSDYVHVQSHSSRLELNLCPAGDLHVTIKAYKAEQEDEISLELGETIEVIHKLLDGWWVVRYRSPTSATGDKSRWSQEGVVEEKNQSREKRGTIIHLPYNYLEQSVNLKTKTDRNLFEFFRYGARLCV